MTVSNRNGQVLGWLPIQSATGTVQLSAAANWYALSFTPDATRTLSTIRTFISAVAGTLAGSDITCDLYDSTGTSGAPGSAIESGKVPSATITASGWYTWTGFSTSLTAGQMYWVVFKNANGTPASNNCTFRFVTNLAMGGTYQVGTGSTSKQNWGEASSTNSGGVWSRAASTSALRVGYSGSLFDGIPVSNATGSATGFGVYSTRELGVKFTSPANAALNVAGIGMLATTPTGTPTGAARFGLWTGTSPVNQGYTVGYPNTTTLFGAGIQVQWLNFASPIALPAASVTRVTLAEATQSDASGNRYNLQEFTWDTDADSLALLPFQGTPSKTYFDGSSWTETSGGMFGFALLLDTAGEFGTPANPLSLIMQPPSAY